MLRIYWSNILKTTYFIDDSRLVWKPTVEADVSRTSKWMMCSEAESYNKIKTDSMDLDDHLLASTMCGLVSDLKGASSFINDELDHSQVTVTCNWTGKLWKESYHNLKELVDQELVQFSADNTEKKSEATHVVVSVLYGAQIFCVFAQDVNGKEEDEHVRKVTQEKLGKMIKKFQVAFDRQSNLDKFKQEFSKEEMHELTHLKCRLYVDLKTESVHDGNLFEAYECCINLKRQIYKDATMVVSKLKGVPIAIQLCPLAVLLPREVVPNFNRIRDVNEKLVDRCCRILADLKRVVVRAKKMYANTEETSPAVSEFVDLVSKYHHSLQENLKKSVVLARSNVNICDGDGNVRSIVEKAETHHLFKTSQLEQWMDSKEAEMDMMKLIVREVGTRVVVLDYASQLAKHVNSKCSLVLTVPPLDERTNEILVAMEKSFTENSPRDNDRNDGLAWHLIPSKKRLVFNYLRELDTHLQKNKEEPIRSIVTFGKSSNPFGCSYSVYFNGKLLNSNLLQLPSPPTGLQIFRPVTHEAQPKYSYITVEWNYEDLGFPCNFWVESQQKGSSDPWVSCRTTSPGKTKLSINCPTGSPMEFRVAADTCIGRSDYSAILDTSVSDADSSQTQENNRVVLQPPNDLKVKSITSF